MTAMINQEALAKAAEAVGRITDALPPTEFARTAITAYIEALPHVDRAGVLEHAGDYSPVAILTSLLRVTEQTVELTNGPFKALYQLQAKALAAAIRALAQPAVNTSPEGVGGWQPIETEQDHAVGSAGGRGVPDLAGLGHRVGTHGHLERTSPKGPGQAFIGRCVNCGAEGLTADQVNAPCPPSPTDERSK